MTRAAIEQSLLDLNQLVRSGRLMDAFEKYSHEDVSMQENNAPPTVTKEANRIRERQFLNDVIELRGADVKSYGIGDDVSFVVWNYDYTHKDWGVRNYMQVSIQEWKDGQIICETFVYEN